MFVFTFPFCTDMLFTLLLKQTKCDGALHRRLEDYTTDLEGHVGQPGCRGVLTRTEVNSLLCNLQYGIFHL